MGLSVGHLVGVAVGFSVEESLGVALGLAGELSVRDLVGVAVGLAMGLSVEDSVGVAVGITSGLAVGDSVGVAIGLAMGLSVVHSRIDSSRMSTPNGLLDFQTFTRNVTLSKNDASAVNPPSPTLQSSFFSSSLLVG